MIYDIQIYNKRILKYTINDKWYRIFKSTMGHGYLSIGVLFSSIEATLKEERQ